MIEHQYLYIFNRELVSEFPPFLILLLTRRISALLVSSFPPDPEVLPMNNSQAELLRQLEALPGSYAYFDSSLHASDARTSGVLWPWQQRKEERRGAESGINFGSPARPRLSVELLRNAEVSTSAKIPDDGIILVTDGVRRGEGKRYSIHDATYVIVVHTEAGNVRRIQHVHIWSGCDDEALLDQVTSVLKLMSNLAHQSA